LHIFIMVFEVKSVTEKFKVQNLEGAPEHVYFSGFEMLYPEVQLLTFCTADLLGTRDNKVVNPIVGSWFLLEKGGPATPPKYEYDEVGVVIEGQFHLLWGSS
jgi:hypothetical protein